MTFHYSSDTVELLPTTGVDMEKTVSQTSDEVFLERFTYWTASLMRGPNSVGWIVIRPVRQGIEFLADEISPRERTELYDVVLPRLERMLTLATGSQEALSKCIRDHYLLIPEKLTIPEDLISSAYLAALHTASA